MNPRFASVFKFSTLNGWLCFGLVMLGSLLGPLGLSAQVSMEVTPTSQTVVEGDVFTVKVELIGPSSQQYDAAEVRLNFDPSLLEVVNNGVTTTSVFPVSLPTEPGGSGPSGLKVDNAQGVVDFVAGAFSNYPSGNLELLDIQFRALAATPTNTALTFSSAFPRESQATFGGFNVLDNLVDGTVSIQPPAICSLSATATAGACDDNGTPSDPSDDFYPVTIDVSATNPVGSQYEVTDGSTVLGTFSYGTQGVIQLPTGGSAVTLTVQDATDNSCSAGAGSVGPVGSCSNANGLTLEVSQVVGVQGFNVSVPVTVANYEDILTGQGGITWDPNVLSYVGVGNFGVPGLSSQSFGLPPNTAGQLLFVWFENTLTHPNGITLSDGDVLFELEFTVLTGPGTSSAVSINTNIGVSEYTQASPSGPLIIPANLIDGSVTVVDQIDISGQAITEDGEIVDDVIFNMAGDVSQSVTGGPSYSLGVPPGSDVSVGASRPVDPAPANGLTGLDLLLINQQILAISPLGSPYKLIAADVNGSGSLTGLDLFLIQGVILQQSTSFPLNNTVWTFVPTDFTFANPSLPFGYDSARSYVDLLPPDLIDQDFYAIKLGDVNDSWTEGGPSVLRTSGSQELGITLPALYAQPGELLEVPVKVEDFDKITGYQFSVSWDPSILQYEGVENEQIEGNFGESRVNEGMLATLWTDPYVTARTLKKGSTLFKLKLRVVGSAGQSAFVRINADMIPAEGYNDQLEILPVEAKAATIQVENATTDLVYSPGNGYKIYPGVPNPFTQETTFSVEIPTQEQVVLRVFNQLGQEVWKTQQILGAGMHEISWQGQLTDGGRLPAGVYYASFQLGEYAQTFKMVMHD